MGDQLGLCLLSQQLQPRGEAGGGGSYWEAASISCLPFHAQCSRPNHPSLGSPSLPDGALLGTHMSLTPKGTQAESLRGARLVGTPGHGTLLGPLLGSFLFYRETEAQKSSVACLDCFLQKLLQLRKRGWEAARNAPVPAAHLALSTNRKDSPRRRGPDACTCRSDEEPGARRRPSPPARHHQPCWET